MTYFRVENLKFHTFTDVSLALSKSECIGLNGPSGIGKSLLLRCLADLDAYIGTVYLEDIPVSSIPAPLWRRQVALLPAEAAWWHPFVKDHFKNNDVKWLECLAFNTSVLDWKISRLSSGEKQRLALLRVLSNDPKVLLLDEPTANLDRENARRIEKLIDHLCRENGLAVIWVSHDIEQLNRVSDRRFLLNSKGLEPVTVSSELSS